LIESQKQILLLLGFSEKRLFSTMYLYYAPNMKASRGGSSEYTNDYVNV